MYVISDIIYFIVYRLVGYRRRVVRDNLAACFPDKDIDWLRDIEKRFYRYLADIAVEFVYNLFASPQNIKSRYRIVNRQLAKQVGVEQGVI